MNKKVIKPEKGLKGKITIPPDKSISHRAVMFSCTVFKSKDVNVLAQRVSEGHSVATPSTPRVTVNTFSEELVTRTVSETGWSKPNVSKKGTSEGSTEASSTLIIVDAAIIEPVSVVDGELGCPAYIVSKLVNIAHLLLNLQKAELLNLPQRG